jgi:FkbM family methyltransferase
LDTANQPEQSGRQGLGGIPPHIQRILNAHAEVTGQQQVVAAIETQNRAGDVLHNLLRTRYDVTIASCKCQEWIDRMNSWGPDGCREHIEEIVDHLFEEASTNENVSAAIRMALKVPIVGKLEGKRQLRNLVTEAITMAESAPHRNMSQEELAVRLQTPAHDWPQGWRDWSNVVEYHRELFRRAMSASVTPASGDGTTGIVIPAGGRCRFYDANAPQYYFWCGFAAAWQLRHVGCTLPIEFWFLPGEMEEIEHCESYAKQVAATCHVLDVSDMRVRGGWQTKVNIILQTKFTHVLHLDADNIVTKDPTYLFASEQYKIAGAMFWSDDPGGRDDFHHRIMPHQWSRLGVSRGVVTDIETGQMLIDKSRSAKALQICKHLADHADYWGGFNGGEKGVWYGDKTDFHVAWKVTETPHYIQPWNMFDHGFFAHVDSAGDRIFQHCCHKKGHLFNGHYIQNLIGNEQIHEAATFKSPLAFLDGTVEDSIRCVAPERMFAIDEQASCREVWLDVFSRNEYMLPPTLQLHDTILDIGANSGAFSYSCLRRGAGKVVACEPIQRSADQCETNCRPAVGEGQTFAVVSRAVWRSDVENPVEVLLSSHEHDNRSTSMTSMIRPATNGIKAETIGLDELLVSLASVHILKIDCEGAEWPVLYTSQELHRCEYIIGEYHSDAQQRYAGDAPDGGWPAWSLEGLQGFLDSQGFEMYRIKEGSKTHGGFWARRKHNDN